MTIAVLSDIHSNAIALKACLAHAQAQGADGYIFLGDYVSDCAYPQRTMALLQDWAARHPCRFIRGNRDEYMAAYQKGELTGWQDGSATGSLLYTYENLTEKDLAWLESLDNQGSEGFPGGPPLFYCHGAPWKTNGTLPEGDKETAERLSALPQPLVLCGHTHRLGIYFLPSLGKHVVRAGSVGVPLSTPGQAQMVFLHSVGGGKPRWQATYALVPYDAEETVRELSASGLSQRAPVWAAMVAHVLLTGENLPGLLPPCAQALCEKDLARKVPLSQVPEPYWQQAARLYGLEPLPQ